MKILFVDQSDHAIPPPTDVIRADTYISVPLAEELKRRGHDITFLCPQGSTVNTKKIFTSTGPLVSVVPLSQYNAIPNHNVRAQLLWTFYVDIYFKLGETIKADQYDLIHYHTNVPSSELVALSKITTPCLLTLHSITSEQDAENKVIKSFNTRPQNYFISISNQQQKSFPSLSFLRTVYHGISINNFTFTEYNEGPLIFAGRLKKSKGLKEAVETSLLTKRKLHIVGAPSYDDQHFFYNEIKPLLEQNKDYIDYSDVVDRTKIAEFYTHAKILLFPIQWEEPFGLVMIEAMATGTPLIAFARGSVPEIMKDGETGFIINSSDQDIRGDWIVKKTGIEGLSEAVERIYNMPEDQYRQMRRNCRKHIETNFTVERMVNDYEKIYQELIDQNISKQ